MEGMRQETPTSSKRPRPAAAAAVVSPQQFSVCVTGLSSEERALAAHLAREVLDGVYQENVDESTTHLVAARVGGPKYKLALHYSIPIVSSSYLHACLAAKQVVSLRGHVLGCFAGLQLCATGFSSRDEARKREIIARIEAEGGGKYSGVLEKDKTTHLIVAVADPLQQQPVSEKQRAAREWNIKMVTLAWVEACLELGAWCPEEDFEVKGDAGEAKPASMIESQDLLAGVEMEKNKTAALDIGQCKQLLERGKNSPPLTVLRRCVVFVDCQHTDETRWKCLCDLALYCGASVQWEVSPAALALTTHYIHTSSGFPLSAELDANLVHVCTPQFLLECAATRARVSELDFAWKRPVNELLKGKVICVSQYGLKERAMIERLTRELGGIYTERLTRFDPRVDVLIFKQGGETSEKYIRAKEWNIQVQNLEWLQSLSNV